MLIRRDNVVLLAFCTLACSGEPVRSYCEALCDWAVTCAQTTRGVDVQALTDECLAATRASDASCESAESGEIGPAAKALLKPCVAAIDDNADEKVCEGFVGSVDEIKASAPPAECASQGADYLATYTEAQLATAETGEELCHRFADTICSRAEFCILGESTQWTAATQALGGTPSELCQERMDAAFTTSCISAQLWEEDESFLDVNAARESARACIPTVSEAECEDIFASPPALSPACASAFTSPEDLAAIGEVLVDLAEEFAAYAR